MSNHKSKFDTLYDEVIRIPDRMFLCEMASFPPDLTGLKKRIYFSIDPKTKHNHIRFKYEIEPDNLVPFIIRTNPADSSLASIKMMDPSKQYSNKISSKEMTDIAEFIRINLSPIIQHWNNKISSYELGQLIKGLK